MATPTNAPIAAKARRTRGATKLASSAPSTAATLSKLEQIVVLLSQPGAASLAELVVATGWQAHSVRGALAGSLKRKGHAIQSEKAAGGRRYRIAAVR